MNRARRYGLALISVVAAFVARLALDPLLHERAPFLVFTLAVLFSAAYAGTGPAIAATLVSLLAGYYAFVEPRWSFAWPDDESIANIAAFALVGASIVWLARQLATMQRRAERGEQAAEVVKQRFELLVQAVQEYAIYMLDADGRIASWNAGAERIKGWRAEEIIGQHFSVFYPAEDVAAGKPDRELEIVRREGGYREEGCRIRKDGSSFIAAVVITPLLDNSGDLRGFAKVTRDITERKEAEDALVRLARDLEHQVEERTRQLADANSELESFSYSVAHDLRAPLRTMHGFSQALLEDYADQLDETGQDYARRVVAGAKQLDALIQDLLAYSRLTREEITFQPVPLDALVDRAVEHLGATVREKGASVEIERPLPMVRAHPAVLSQVLGNLLNNALKFVPQGVEPRIKIRGEVSGDVARIWVEDNGIGIAPEHQGRIFDVFQRLHSVHQYPGTGIGLAIVRKGIERHNGQVGVESEPGRGSRFWVELERADA